jgi:hypothetical protein
MSSCLLFSDENFNDVFPCCFKRALEGLDFFNVVDK